MIEPASPPRRRALMVRGKKIKNIAGFMANVEDEMHKTLALHFDLTVIDQDFDYGEACDRINPDFVIFETPGGSRPVPVEIRNRTARLDIPRIGFTNQDPHDTARVLFLQMLDDMQIDSFIAHGGESFFRQSPELNSRGYTSALYIDDTIFHDYGEQKIIPISVMGGMMCPSFYQWRAALTAKIANHIPTLIYAHPGYEAEIPSYKFPLKGEDYARMLNRSYFSLSDVTALQYPVRKHLEIPACGAALVTAAVPDLAWYGFRDMESCIIGEGDEALAKIAHVANNPDLYAAICKNGAAVARRHTRENWRYFNDWYECHRTLRPGEMVQQQGVYGRFQAVSGGRNVPRIAEAAPWQSVFQQRMRRALALIIDNGNLEDARAELNDMANWLGHLCEPVFPLGLIALIEGAVDDAQQLFARPFEIRKNRDGLSLLDPEEIAWLWFCGMLRSDARLVEAMQQMASAITHVSLRRMAWLEGRLSGGSSVLEKPERLYEDRLSTHWLGEVAFKDWLSLVNRILIANSKNCVVA